MTAHGDKRSRRLLASSRGAIFVEAIIVISSFTLMLMGLVFFHHLYRASFALHRLSRSSAIAYSMGGCESNEPASWLGRDLGTYSSNGQQQSSPNTGGSRPGATGSEKVDQISGENEALQDGTAVNRMAVSVVSGRASGGRRGSLLTGYQSVFEKELSGRATVSCGDVVRSGSYGEVIGYVEDMVDW